MAHRWHAARLIDEGLPYHEVAKRSGASTTTVTRVAHWLRYGEDGYRLRARPARQPGSDRLTIAVPAKGRLREPAVRLLADAGLGPEQPGERALAFPCRNAPVDVLLVRAADVPEYVRDGVVDCGITGADLVRERGVEVDELLRLGFGACTLEAAVPEEHEAWDARRAAGPPGGDGLSRASPGGALRERGIAVRARRGHRLGRGRAAARPRGRDRRSGLERQHDADERPPLARWAVLARRRCSSAGPTSGEGAGRLATDPPHRRRRACAPGT